MSCLAIFITAGYVIKSMRLTCDECADFVSEQPPSVIRDDLSLISVKDRGGLHNPNLAVTNMCIAAEKVVRRETESGIVRDTYQILTMKTMTLVYLNNLHATFPVCHSTALVKTIVSRYCLIRLRHELTKIERTDNMRQKMTRLVIFNHV